MTFADDFVPGGQQQNGGSEYPTAFGIQFTPKVIGIVIAVLGLAGAGYLYMNLVQPILETNKKLQNDIATEIGKQQKPEEIQERQKQAQAKLAQAKQQKNSVLALFANQQNLKTLLLDLNKRIENRNTALKPDDIKAKLRKFQPDPKLSGVVNDGSLGDAVNNELYREVYNVELEGTFAQTMLSMVDFERLKPLLIVKNLKSQLDAQDNKIYVYPQQGKLVPVKVDLQQGQPIVKIDPQSNKPIVNPAIKLKTSFQLQALRPLTAEEKVKLQPPPQTDQSQGQPQSTNK